ncbi:MAG: glycosyltransferase family 4 protein [Candidatus Binatia bacterium]
MRILFLSHYFPPEVNAPASRTYEHCKQWVEDGFDVTVVTCVPNHPRGKVYEGYRNKLWQREEKDGVQVIRLWSYVTANEGFVKRTLNYISYMIAVILATPFLPKADVVVSTSPQFFNGLAGYFVSRLKRVPWVLEIRDLWPESIRAVGAIRNRWVIRMIEFMERFAYQKADRIVPLTNAFKRYMVERGISPGKIEVIENGVDLAFYRPLCDENPLTGKLGLKGKFIASYCGTHGMAHHLETVLEAARQLREYQDIVFLLVGDGAERERLVAMRSELRLGNVMLLGQQPKEKMPFLYALSDVSLVLLKESDCFKMVIPSKIFESLAMQKPVILGIEGESANIIEAANAGFCIEPENSKKLAELILELHDHPDLGAQLGRNGRRHVVQHYDRTILARRYEALLESMNHQVVVNRRW